MLKNGRLTSPIVSCKWLHDHIELEHLIILDARVNSNFEDYIPNSRYFDIKEKFSNTEAEFPNTIPSLEQFQKEARQLGINNNSIVVVYDDKGLYWSPRVWWLFKTFGYDNVAVLNGGLPEWKKHQYDTVSSLAKPIWSLGDFLATYQSDTMCFFKQMAKISEDNNYQVLDARSKERFKSLVPEPRAGLRSGTIPNSKNLPYTHLLNGNCLKSKTELEFILNTYNIEDKSLIFSCGSGITACILALAAEVSGYKKNTVYDGSWTEYGTLTK